MAATEEKKPKEKQGEGEKRVGCAHYKRRAKFVTPCCNKFYMCRYCHDENESHFFNRKTVTELICTECNTRQRVQAECEKCGVRFGRYTCLVCNLFDDEDRNQYHCDGCGICRVGGRGRFFHCKVCNMCLPMQLQVDGHRSKKTSEILHQYNSLKMDVQLKQTVEMFLIQLMHHPIKFTACGMFTLDYSVLFSIITSATSYLIILIQFEMANNCGRN